MTALAITGCTLLFLAVLLFSPIVLRVTYSGKTLGASVRYLAFAAKFTPEKRAKREEKRKKRDMRRAKKAPRKKKAPKDAEDKNEETAEDIAKVVWSLVKTSKKGLDILRKNLVFYKIRATIVAGGEDAQQAALNYARMCTLTANGLAALDVFFVVKEPDISISMDFTSEDTKLDAAFKVRIAPAYILSAGLRVFLRFLKVIRENKEKGGKNNESAACYQ